MPCHRARSIEYHIIWKKNLQNRFQWGVKRWSQSHIKSNVPYIYAKATLCNHHLYQSSLEQHFNGYYYDFYDETRSQMIWKNNTQPWICVLWWKIKCAYIKCVNGEFFQGMWQNRKSRAEHKNIKIEHLQRMQRCLHIKMQNRARTPAQNARTKPLWAAHIELWIQTWEKSGPLNGKCIYAIESNERESIVRVYCAIFFFVHFTCGENHIEIYAHIALEGGVYTHTCVFGMHSYFINKHIISIERICRKEIEITLYGCFISERFSRTQHNTLYKF